MERESTPANKVAVPAGDRVKSSTLPHRGRLNDRLRARLLLGPGLRALESTL
jgi:hypothetical protein